MSDIVRSGDEEKDMESWMKRTAAMLARLLVETEFGTCEPGEDAASAGLHEADD